MKMRKNPREGKKANAKTKSIYRSRGREGHGIFGDCQILKPCYKVDACWWVMGIDATGLLVRVGAQRDTNFMPRQVDFIKWTLEFH